MPQGNRKDTWLLESKLDFRKIVLLICCWTKKLSTIDFWDEELGFLSPTTVDWKHFPWEVCAWSLLQTPIVIDGTGLYVEIDETLISHRKNYTKRIFHSNGFSAGLAEK